MKSTKKQQLMGYLFIAPALLFFVLFTLIPITIALVLSFTKYGVFNDPVFIGLENYINIFKVDPLFIKSFKNVFIYVIIVVPSIVILSLLLATLLNKKIRGAKIFRALYYLPSLTSIIAASAVWRFIYDPQYGPLNQFLSFFGVQRSNLPLWLYHPNTAMLSIAILSIWMILGTNTIIYLAALQNFPKEVKEAAQIDGANGFQMLTRIVFPILKPTTYFIITMCIIGSFQLYDQVYALTSGGPAGRTMTPVYLIYLNAFDSYNMGYASAQSVILFIVILIVTLISQRFVSEKS